MLLRDAGRCTILVWDCLCVVSRGDLAVCVSCRCVCGPLTTVCCTYTNASLRLLVPYICPSWLFLLPSYINLSATSSSASDSLRKLAILHSNLRLDLLPYFRLLYRPPSKPESTQLQFHHSKDSFICRILLAFSSTLFGPVLLSIDQFVRVWALQSSVSSWIPRDLCPLTRQSWYISQYTFLLVNLSQCLGSCNLVHVSERTRYHVTLPSSRWSGHLLCIIPSMSSRLAAINAVPIVSNRSLPLKWYLHL